MQITRSDCLGKRPCGHWRICERCARIRSARIATRAEFMESRHGKLAIAVVKPPENTARALRTLRDKLLRRKLAPAGIWTIEAGELFGGLHLNLLFPSSHLALIEKQTSFAEDVRTTARAAAAYISKRSSMPLPEQWEGRLYGEWGSISQIIMRDTTPDTASAQAALLEYSLRSPEQKAALLPAQREAWEYALARHPLPVERTREEYAQIARRNLATVYMTLGR